MYIYNHIFIHLSVDGHLGGFHILAIINNAAINFEVHGSFLIKFFFFWMSAPEWDCWVI